ncbi:MFS transporter [Frigidibacter sp. ROC022]|uniref:MFS transporter n=1 Tax=Frigidibacter sp. ROC022 TaxID=2971796 RepID=UPI00215AA4A6|nr:MFS transporter [Frigidibacter sp. ROC022]MCR8723483.1 MFS transporter [Frigidibacter sp. ROC022]
MTDFQSPYRWVIVAVAAVMLAVSMGQLVNGLSSFFLPLEAEFGWGRGEIALINTFGLIGLGLGGILMGRVADRVGIRGVVLTGAITTGLSVLAASQARELWQLYALFFVAGAVGGGALFAPLITLVGVWFRAGAGLAIGLVAAGQAIGQGGVPLVSALLIEAFGWRGAFMTLGLGSLVTLVPLALLIRPPPTTAATVSQAGGDIRALGAVSAVVVMGAATLMCCSLMSVPLMHLLPYAQDCGIPAAQAGGIVSVMMLAAIVGRVAFGQLADWIGAIPAYLAASAWQTALVFLFTQFHDVNQLLAFAPVYGFGYAGVMTGVLLTIRRVTPAESRATCTGVIVAFAWAGHGLGGVVGGYLYDATANYDLTFAVAAAAGVVNLAIVGSLGLWLSRDRSQVPSPRGAALPR